ncbi:MAG: Ribonuclease regulator RraA [Chloroflexi bacterium]|nr:Ribonuclease regulator RraA [Chloroflexota bacterium]
MTDARSSNGSVLSDTPNLPGPNIDLPVTGPAFQRPSKHLIEQLYKVSSATASAGLHKLGIRRTFIQGPQSRQPGTKVVGSVVTLQFMPQREDIVSGLGQEYVEKHSALWAVLKIIEPGDILTVQANADPYTGCFGEMLVSYFKERGGVALVVDGYIRDWPHVKELNLPIWCRGLTPNYASQSDQFPWAYNVPVSVSGVLALPGDIMLADDDGAVLIPANVAPLLLQRTLEHEEWEVFSRKRLAEGGSLEKYYPLNEEGRREYEIWRQELANQPG